MTGTDVDQETRVRVRREQTLIIRGHLPIVFGGTVVISAIVGILLWWRTGLPYPLYWLAAIVVLTAIRALHARFSNWDLEDLGAINRQLTILTLFSGCAGLIWGSAGIEAVLPLSDDLALLTLVVMVLCGMAAGSVASLSAFMPVYYAFAIPTILPFSTAFLLNENIETNLLGAMALVFLAVNLGYSRNIYRTILEVIEIRFRNDSLLEELEAARDRAERSNLAKSQFLAATSHDMRQPLSASVFFAATLKRRLKGTPNTELVDNLLRSTNAFRELLDAILEISRIEAGGIDINIKPMSIQTVFDQMDLEFSAIAQRRRIDFSIRPTDAVIKSDVTHFARIVRNLVSNAIKYTESGSRILLACRKRGDQWSVEVWDTGVGIADEMQERIFDEYIQASNPERRREKGLGLGLAIVRGLCARLDHQVNVRSRPGRGSVFRVLGEICTDAPPLEIPPTVVEDRDAANGLEILVVEDDELVRTGLMGLLESWNHRAIPAASAAEAERVADALARPPHLIISDFRLPGETNGIELIQRLHDMFGDDLPSLIITGDTDPDWITHVQSAGIAILHKPIAPAKLQIAIDKLTRQGTPSPRNQNGSSPAGPDGASIPNRSAKEG